VKKRNIVCSCGHDWNGDKCTEAVVPPNSLPIILAVSGAVVVALGVIMVLLWKRHNAEKSSGYEPLSLN